MGVNILQPAMQLRLALFALFALCAVVNAGIVIPGISPVTLTGTSLTLSASPITLSASPVTISVSPISPISPISPVTVSVSPISPISVSIAPVSPVSASIAPVSPVSGSIAPVSPVSASLAPVSPLSPVSAISGTPVSPIDYTTIDPPTVSYTTINYDFTTINGGDLTTLTYTFNGGFETDAASGLMPFTLLLVLLAMFFY